MCIVNVTSVISFIVMSPIYCCTGRELPQAHQYFHNTFTDAHILHFLEAVTHSPRRDPIVTIFVSCVDRTKAKAGLPLLQHAVEWFESAALELVPELQGALCVMDPVLVQQESTIIMQDL